MKQAENPNITQRSKEVRTSITGAELRAARKRLGLNQSQMGERIGFSRYAVSYWETKQSPIANRNAFYGAPKAMLEELGIEILRYLRTSTRTRGDGVLGYWESQQLALDAAFQKEIPRIRAKEEAKRARLRQRCGAKTRKGLPCRNMSEAGRRRCKFHGGKSTGPKTPEGKERIAVAQRKRWARNRKNNVPT